MGADTGDQLPSPAIIRNPGIEYSRATRRFEGIPSIACSSQGRLWATWYAGTTPGEDQNNYVILATSINNGETWDEVMVVDPDGPGPIRAYDPELWADPEGRLWFFWAQQITSSSPAKSPAELWVMNTVNAGDMQPAWSPPKKITCGVMMCKPSVLSTGEWCLPVSAWMQPTDSARCVLSTDHGRTWEIRGACHVPIDVRSYDEHRIIEKKDATLIMWVRTKYGIGESISTDHGLTWSNLTPSAVKHTNSRFFMGRLASGNLLLVKNGSLHEDCGRSHLTAFLSTDEGKTWPYSLLLDERSRVSYPDADQCKNETIYITYDFDRVGAREILMARLTEKDIMQGSVVAARSRLRMKVN